MESTAGRFMVPLSQSCSLSRYKLLAVQLQLLFLLSILLRASSLEFCPNSLDLAILLGCRSLRGLLACRLPRSQYSISSQASRVPPVVSLLRASNGVPPRLFKELLPVFAPADSTLPAEEARPVLEALMLFCLEGSFACSVCQSCISDSKFVRLEYLEAEVDH